MILPTARVMMKHLSVVAWDSIKSPLGWDFFLCSGCLGNSEDSDSLL